MTAIVTIGIDLAKNVFAVHGVDATGKPALVRPSVPRAKLLELIAALAPKVRMAFESRQFEMHSVIHRCAMHHGGEIV